MYVCILAIAALQFVIAYSNISGPQMFARMLFLAVVEAALALLFFMHLSDNHGLLWFVFVFTVFVLLAMQYGWTDSFRELLGRALVKLFKVLTKGGAAFEEKDMKSLSSIRLMGIALAGLFVLLAPLPAFSQNCALCYTQASSAGARMIEALRSGILVMVIPPTLGSIGMIFIVRRRNNQFKRDESAVEDW